jgi:hypothetical protein
MEGAIPVVDGDELFGHNRPVGPVPLRRSLDRRGTGVHHLGRDSRFALGRHIRHKMHMRLRGRGFCWRRQRWYRCDGGRKTNQRGWGVNRIFRISERDVETGAPWGRVLNTHSMTDVSGVALNADELSRTPPVLKTVLNSIVQVVIYSITDTNIPPVTLVVWKGTFDDLSCLHTKKKFPGPVQNFYRFCSGATWGFRGRKIT